MKLEDYRCLATAAEALANCKRNDNPKWDAKHRETIGRLMAERFPSGSGIDSGCSLMESVSGDTGVTMKVPFHAMNENGVYVGWLVFLVTVSPRFTGVEIDVCIYQTPDSEIPSEEVAEHWSEQNGVCYESLKDSIAERFGLTE